MDAAATTMTLPAERGTQLRAFAAKEGLGLVEAVGRLLSLAGAADIVPGFEIECIDQGGDGLPPRYKFAFDGFAVEMPFMGVVNLSTSITFMLQTAGIKPRCLTFETQRRELSFGRGSGSSLIIAGTDTSTGEVVRRRLSLDVAGNLAEQLIRVLPTGPRQ